MKLENLYQEHDAPAPYADSLVLDAGGMNIMHGGEDIAYVSFEGLDPFEIAFHAMPTDWEHHEGWDGGTQKFTPLSIEQQCENHVYNMLTELGKLKGWERN